MSFLDVPGVKAGALDTSIEAKINDTASATRGALNATYAALTVGGKGVVRKDELTFNVKDYGATGNGVADDTAAITAAIAAAGTGVVYFPPGTYMAGNISLTAATTLTAAPGRVATVKRNANGNLITVNGANTDISNLILDGNGGTYTGTVVTIQGTATDFTADNVYALNAGAGSHTIHTRRDRTTVTGSRIDGNVYTENGDDLVVDNCRFFAPAYAGTTDFFGVGVAALTSAANHADNARITNNHFRITTNVFAICPISRNGAIPPRGTLIANNVMIADAVACHGGISVDTCADATVTGNVFRVASGTPVTGALEIVKSNNVTAAGNDFDGGSIMAILVSLNNASDCTVSGNTLRNPTATGVPNLIHVQAPAASNRSDRNLITGNKFIIPAGGGRAVLVSTNAAGCTADGNAISSNSVYGNASSRGFGLDANTGTVTNTAITDNTVHTASIACRVFNDTGTTYSGNRAYSVTDTLLQAGTGGTGMQAEGNSWQFAAAAPTTSYHVKGERVMNNAPTIGSPTGWVCTVSGTPGTWVALANL